MNTHIWLRAEERANEKRTGLMPDGVEKLRKAGATITVEASTDRIIPDSHFADAGATMVPAGSWRDAPKDAIILGLKELPDDQTPLAHRHIMFGHAFKGQPDGPQLLRRFVQGGGTLLDLEYLTDDTGRRLAAFGYWAGFAGAAIALKAWAAAQQGHQCAPVETYASADEMVADVRAELAGAQPSAIVIGALGRVGTGARDMCDRVGVGTTNWDIAETRDGGPFPQIMAHDILLNSILAGPGGPVFVRPSDVAAPRKLTAIGDIACDPGSDYNPIPIYDAATSWDAPVVRVATNPPLDVMAIDNLPSLMPAESSQDFAGQLLPLLGALNHDKDGMWARAAQTFAHHTANLGDK